jgi:hypothetical protein
MGKRGAPGERKVANFVDGIEGISAKRNLNETREGNRGDVLSNIPFVIEAKNKDQPSVWKAVEEADEASEELPDSKGGIAFVRRKNGRGRKADKRVAMTWETFRALVNHFRQEVEDE